MTRRELRNRPSVWMAVVLASATTVAGCGTLGGTAAGVGDTASEAVRQHPETVVGAGAGAAGGAVIGGIAGGSRGAVIGGLLGALTGGAIGHYVERREADRSPVVAGPPSTPAAGAVLRIERADPAPLVVSPGGTVHLNATYTVASPGGQPVLVRESREVRHNGELVANPTTEVQRLDGTYTTGLPITLPPRAERGTYEVTTTVAMGDRRSSQTSSFQVQ